MPNRLRVVLGHLWAFLGRRPAPAPVEPAPARDSAGWSDARARFWNDFREGQREADARGARVR